MAGESKGPVDHPERSPKGHVWDKLGDPKAGESRWEPMTTKNAKCGQLEERLGYYLQLCQVRQQEAPLNTDAVGIGGGRQVGLT